MSGSFSRTDVLMNRYRVAAASVAGAAHVRSGRANQDAFAVRRSEAGIAVVVCDGCGSGAHSELGARLGANLVAQRAMEAIESGTRLDRGDGLSRLSQCVVSDLAAIAAAMGDSPTHLVAEHFLFTVLGAVVERERAVVFGLGDGVFAIDDLVTTIGPYPNNAPPYLGYALLNDRARELAVHHVVSGAMAITLGSDGACDLSAFADLANEARHFSNRDGLRRTLACEARSVTLPNWAERRLETTKARLEDDTTVVIVRAGEV